MRPVISSCIVQNYRDYGDDLRSLLTWFWANKRTNYSDWASDILKKKDDFKSLGIVSCLFSKVNNTMVNTLRVALEDEDSI